MKAIEETHPSLREHVGIGVFMKTKVCTIDEIQEHTIDKNVLKNVIINLEEEYNEDKGATRFAVNLLKKLGLWESVLGEAE